MSHSKLPPGSRLLLYLASAMGAARTADELVIEARAPHVAVDPSTHAEGAGLNPKVIWIAGIGVLLGLWAIVLLLYPLFTYYKYQRTGGKDPAKLLQYLPPSPPAPQNINSPYSTLEQFRKREDAILNSYRWVDRKHGLASIPIARAIQILAQDGIPTSSAPSKDYFPPKAGSMRTGFEGKVEPEPR